MSDDQRAASVVNYDGPDPSVECAYPGCTNRLRESDFPGPQFCSPEHRDAAQGALAAKTREWTYSNRAVWIGPGPGGPGGWSCHTTADGQTFPAICLADDCPEKEPKP